MQETFRRAFEPAARAAYDGLRPYAPYLVTIQMAERARLYPPADAVFMSLEGTNRWSRRLVYTRFKAP